MKKAYVLLALLSAFPASAGQPPENLTVAFARPIVTTISWGCIAAVAAYGCKMDFLGIGSAISSFFPSKQIQQGVANLQGATSTIRSDTTAIKKDTVNLLELTQKIGKESAQIFDATTKITEEFLPTILGKLSVIDERTREIKNDTEEIKSDAEIMISKQDSFAIQLDTVSKDVADLKSTAADLKLMLMSLSRSEQHAMDTKAQQPYTPVASKKPTGLGLLSRTSSNQQLKVPNYSQNMEIQSNN